MDHSLSSGVSATGKKKDFSHPYSHVYHEMGTYDKLTHHVPLIGPATVTTVTTSSAGRMMRSNASWTRLATSTARLSRRRVLLR